MNRNTKKLTYYTTLAISYMTAIMAFFVQISDKTKGHIEVK